MNCPYCQHPGPHSLAGTRSICGKCGESFAYSAPEANPEPAPDLAANVVSHRQMRQKQGMLSVRRAFYICISFGILSFAAGLTYRWYHAKKVDSGNEVASQNEPYQPLKIPALRFLPANLDGVAAVQVQHLRDKVGVTEQFSAILTELKFRADWVQKLPETLGTDWSNVLEIAVGFKTDQRLIPPQIWLVLHVREAIDEDDIVNVARGRRIESNKRHYIRFVGPSGLSLVGWKPVEKYYLIALDEGDFDQLPDGAKPDSSHLNPKITAQMTSFGKDDMLAWLAFDTTALPPTTGTVMNAVSPVAAQWLGQLGSISIGLRLEPDAKIGAWIEAKNDDIAREWREKLLKVLSAQPGQAQVGGAGKICFVTFVFDANAIKMFNR